MKRRVGLAAVALAIALTAAGCGTGGISKSADASAGQQLFLNGKDGKPSCASCHTLKAAGANGKIGPNLDDAFAFAYTKGTKFKQETLEQVVLDQIRLAACVDPNDPRLCMPRNLVTGDDAKAVAAYVAQVAGNPSAQAPSGGGGGITGTNGKDIFQSAGCTSCHTLRDAGSTGTIGPNLDQAKPPTSLVVDRVTNGRGAMPSFKDRLSKQQIDAVATYVSSVAGK